MRDEPGGTRSTDVVVAWLLYALQLAGELVLTPLWLMSVMMTDSCGSVADEPSVCNPAYFTTGWIAIIVAGKRGNRRWKWPVIAIAVLVVGTGTFVWAFTR
jgi:hypothetical protein